MAIPAPTDLESIDHVPGSLGRTQVCNLALLRAGDDVPLAVRTAGLDRFFAQHRFLDVARMRPVPHEAYYRNAGYFWCYAHAYAGEVIATLPEAEQGAYAPRLWDELARVAAADGSAWDYPFGDYAKVYGTAFLVRALVRTLPGESPGE
jgi:hypothetical protein